MKRYTCIVVDDETLAQELLERHISKIPNLDHRATCSNAIDAKFAIEQYQPDLLLLDIEMPHLSGIDLLRLLKKRPATILTTAYSEYALESYELDVVDYLIKPIEFERFFKAVSKAVDWLGRGQLPLKPKPVSAAYFFVKSDYKIIKVVFEEIIFIEAVQKYVRIHTHSDRIITLMSMSQLEEALPTGKFIRIHRSYIVNLDKIDSIEGNMVRIDKHNLPLSKGQKEAFWELVWQNGKMGNELF